MVKTDRGQGWGWAALSRVPWCLSLGAHFSFFSLYLLLPWAPLRQPTSLKSHRVMISQITHGCPRSNVMDLCIS